MDEVLSQEIDALLRSVEGEDEAAEGDATGEREAIARLAPLLAEALSSGWQVGDLVAEEPEWRGSSEIELAGKGLWLSIEVSGDSAGHLGIWLPAAAVQAFFHVEEAAALPKETAEAFLPQWEEVLRGVHGGDLRLLLSEILPREGDDATSLPGLAGEERLAQLRCRRQADGKELTILWPLSLLRTFLAGMAEEEEEEETPPSAADTPPSEGERPARPATPSPAIERPRFGEIEAASGTSSRRNIDLLLDVPLTLTVELGRADRQIHELLALGPGSVIELDRAAGEAVDILVNGKLLAKGEVVVIDDNFGVRITDIVSPAERLNRLR